MWPYEHRIIKGEKCDVTNIIFVLSLANAVKNSKL